jgi:hypothetical protein
MLTEWKSDINLEDPLPLEMASTLSLMAPSASEMLLSCRGSV